MIPDDEAEALWANYKKREWDARFWGMCCNDCAGWVYPSDVVEYEAEATELFLRTGRMEPLE